jgi:hypothetical protein
MLNGGDWSRLPQLYAPAFVSCIENPAKGMSSDQKLLVLKWRQRYIRSVFTEVV